MKGEREIEIFSKDFTIESKNEVLLSGSKLKIESVKEDVEIQVNKQFYVQSDKISLYQRGEEELLLWNENGDIVVENKKDIKIKSNYGDIFLDEKGISLYSTKDIHLCSNDVDGKINGIGNMNINGNIKCNEICSNAIHCQGDIIQFGNEIDCTIKKTHWKSITSGMR